MGNVKRSYIAEYGSTMVIEYSDLKNVIDDSYVNDATVSATIVDSTGVNVAGQAWPISLTYVNGSNGVYRGLLPHTVLIDVEMDYKLITEALTTGGLRRYREDDVKLVKG